MFIFKKSVFGPNFGRVSRGAARGVATRQLREIRGDKIKIGGAKVFAEFFWPKSQIFRPKAGDLQKKEKKRLRRNPKALSSRNRKFYVFFAQKQQLLPPKKIPWAGKKKIGEPKTKIGGALPPQPPAGDAPGSGPKILRETIAFAAQQLYTKIKFRCFVV